MERVQKKADNVPKCMETLLFIFGRVFFAAARVFRSFWDASVSVLSFIVAGFVNQTVNAAECEDNNNNKKLIRGKKKMPVSTFHHSRSPLR